MTKDEFPTGPCGRCATCRCAARAWKEENDADPDPVGAVTAGQALSRDVPAARRKA
jgi:hypothetical protein